MKAEANKIIEKDKAKQRKSSKIKSRNEVSCTELNTSINPKEIENAIIGKTHKFLGYGLLKPNNTLSSPTLKAINKRPKIKDSVFILYYTNFTRLLLFSQYIYKEVFQ